MMCLGALGQCVLDAPCQGCENLLYLGVMSRSESACDACDIRSGGLGLLKWGNVGDVIIPNKRDRRGKRFGFVRFKQNEGKDIPLEALYQVWIVNYKVKINSPRFKRLDDKSLNERSAPTRREPILAPSPPFHSFKPGKNNSWKEVLMNGKTNHNSTTSQNRNTLVYEIPEGRMESL
ncbi:hypothetical protein TanjilG_07142 [Lupinus angustifolius]|uniref:RRM domain-containing protein n=1 Tax=Lupinus angustifolius TaxID=3871 RepID=A0A1J7GMU8_LUPAN|nr:hypothetical protein TanjilG_07142 [Lupinus angustifolius]